MKAYLWSTNNGNASCTFNGCQRHRQGANLASGKLRIVYNVLHILILVKCFSHNGSVRVVPTAL